MITVHELKKLVGEHCFNLREDSPIQLIDCYTGAHFRYNGCGVLLLGGDCYSGQLDDLWVSGIAILTNCVEIYLDA